MVLVIWSVTSEIDEACLVGMERELVPSKTLAQNAQNPFGVLEIRNAITGRVAERNFTSPPSQIRTGRSRVIRLLPPNLRSHALFPQDK